MLMLLLIQEKVRERERGGGGGGGGGGERETERETERQSERQRERQRVEGREGRRDVVEKGKLKRESYLYIIFTEYKPGDVVTKHNDMDCFGQAVSGNNRVCLISFFIIVNNFLF